MSAFAKRRKLNDQASTSAESASEGEQLKSAKALDRVSQKSSGVPPVLSHDDPEPSEATSSGTGNSFEPLVKANAVDFTGTREIEQLDERSYRIRLSKGQVRGFIGIDCRHLTRA